MTTKFSYTKTSWALEQPARGEDGSLTQCRENDRENLERRCFAFRESCCRRELRNRVENGRVESGEALTFFKAGGIRARLYAYIGT